MPGRRRRRERRAHPLNGSRRSASGGREAGSPRQSRSPHAAKADAREFEASMRRMKRTRSILGAVGFVPLIASLLAASGVEAFGVIPRDVYLLAWAAIFGAFLGLTFRMWRARRAFVRARTA